MPRPAFWYRGGLPAGSFAPVCGTPLSPQSSFSLLFVPELSPRETKFARLAGADRDELEVVLREALLELRRDELVEHAGVADARRALHDERSLRLLSAGRRGAGQRHRERECHRARPAARRSCRHTLRPPRRPNVCQLLTCSILIQHAALPRPDREAGGADRR